MPLLPLSTLRTHIDPLLLDWSVKSFRRSLFCLDFDDLVAYLLVRCEQDCHLLLLLHLCLGDEGV